MKIVDELDPNTEFSTAYIDDLAEERDSMIDLFVFEPY
jgi:hypothetical protein